MSPLSVRSLLLVPLTSLVVFLLIDHAPSRLPVHIDGHVDDGFESVRDVFRQNFVEGWERGGAALVVIKDGKTVVDLWGGYADPDAHRRWKDDTVQVTFSTTKGVAAVCLAVLVDRGHLSYDDLVTKYWPEFGKHGKDNVTVEMLLTHQAGLAYLDEDVTEEEAADPQAISRRLEDQRPLWSPGRASGYHIYTFGWLADQLVRRVDPAGRSIGRFVKEELHDAFNVDFYIGLPDNVMGRVARLRAPSLIDRLSEMVAEPKLAALAIHAFQLLDPSSMLSRALHNLPFLECIHQMTVNNPDYWRIEQAAALGIGNARSLAQIYSLLASGRLVSDRTLSLLSRPTLNQTDNVLHQRTAKGHGFFYDYLDNPKRPGSPRLILGHPGHGCQQALVELDTRIAVAYTGSALKMAHDPAMCRTWKRLQAAILEVID